MKVRQPMVAQAAMRAALTRALSATVKEARRGVDRDGYRERPLNRYEHAVLGALVVLICTYDRTEDRVARRQIIDLAGGDERSVARALDHLTQAGVIEREPGTGRTASLIRFPLADGAASPGRGVGTGPMEGVRPVPTPGGGPSVTRGGSQQHEEGVPDPASEVFPEDPPEGEPLTLARAMVVRHGDEGELAAVVQLIVEAGNEPTLRQMHDDGRRFTWPRDLQAATGTTRPTPAPPAQIHPSRIERPACTECKGMGFVIDDDTGNALRCGCNNPHAVGQ